jgi:hypothetical protein
MKNNFLKGVFVGLLTCLLYFVTSAVMLDNCISKQKIDYQLEFINENDVKLLDENGETLYITTFDSIPYYIDQDNI